MINKIIHTTVTLLLLSICQSKYQHFVCWRLEEVWISTHCFLGHLCSPTPSWLSSPLWSFWPNLRLLLLTLCSLQYLFLGKIPFLWYLQRIWKVKFLQLIFSLDIIQCLWHFLEVFATRWHLKRHLKLLLPKDFLHKCWKIQYFFFCNFQLFPWYKWLQQLEIHSP